MAVVGGTQGAQVSNVHDVQELARIALSNMNSSKASPSRSDMALLQNLMESSPLQFNSGPSKLSFNFEDNMPLDDDTPLQFKKEQLGNCRAFYLQSDLLDISSTWERIAVGSVPCVDGGSLGATWQKKSLTATVGDVQNSAVSLSAANWVGLIVAMAFALV
jgi:hypothetical protein